MLLDQSKQALHAEDETDNDFMFSLNVLNNWIEGRI